MSCKLSIAFFVHAIRSDWNNGNAHFLRGLARALGCFQAEDGLAQGLGHRVTVFEPAPNWSTENLGTEPNGEDSIQQFERVYSDLHVTRYTLVRQELRAYLDWYDIVIVHEWNPPELIEHILALRDELGFRALFHDTHHRASSSPEQLSLLQVSRFDGVIAFGEALRHIYLTHFGLKQVWTLHEAADTTIFHPSPSDRRVDRTMDAVWIGNWGDNERSQEICEYLIQPASQLPQRRFYIYGVRYPQEALQALTAAAITYGGYLPNLEAPAVYAASRLTVHIPRQPYVSAMAGIPTIRVFEALACGIPLISAPWQDIEGLFAPGDFLLVRSSDEMREAIDYLLMHPIAAEEQSAKGLQTVLERHTCSHRALELTRICEEVLA